MPECVKCGHRAATVEFRRSPKKSGIYLCKDKIACMARTADLTAKMRR